MGRSWTSRVPTRCRCETSQPRRGCRSRAWRTTTPRSGIWWRRRSNRSWTRHNANWRVWTWTIPIPRPWSGRWPWRSPDTPARRRQAQLWLHLAADHADDHRATLYRLNERVADTITSGLLAWQERGRLQPGRSVEVEAARLHALVDGLSLQVVTEPKRMTSARVRQVPDPPSPTSPWRTPAAGE